MNNIECWKVEIEECFVLFKVRVEVVGLENVCRPWSSHRQTSLLLKIDP
jgi:hypothetical protein